MYKPKFNGGYLILLLLFSFFLFKLKWHNDFAKKTSIKKRILWSITWKEKKISKKNSSANLHPWFYFDYIWILINFYKEFQTKKKKHFIGVLNKSGICNIKKILLSIENGKLIDSFYLSLK